MNSSLGIWPHCMQLDLSQQALCQIAMQGVNTRFFRGLMSSIDSTSPISLIRPIGLITIQASALARQLTKNVSPRA